MVNLNITLNNVLDAQVQGIILTIDGSAAGMEGNIARAFARRWPDVWEEIEDELTFPVASGSVFEHEPSSNCPFDMIMLASTLVHHGDITEARRFSVVAEALENALRLAHSYEIQSLATAVMTGGWRLPLQRAFMAMMQGIDTASRQGFRQTVEICIPDKAHYEQIRHLASSLGYSGGGYL